MSGSRWPGTDRLARLCGLAVLLSGLLLSLLPGAPLAATPPDVVPEAVEAAAPAESDSTEGEGDSGARQAANPAKSSQDGAVGGQIPEDRAAASVSSIRARGLEAPVELRAARERGGDNDLEPAREARSEGPDPGDGPIPRRDRKPRERMDDRAELPSRVWPMPKEAYTFTQQFGCTQQLGNLYFPGDGCPASAPVIHTGIDLAAPEGTPFYATASGWVTLADYDRPTADANTRIIIQHDGRNEGYATDYLHWIASYVEEGDYVRAGEPIGEVGSVGYSTGPHLHFSVTDLETGEHIDPVRWLPKDSAPDDYPRSTLPRAQLRLPAGTTLGHPEAADPSPPAPPVREDVPDSPPADERDRDRSDRRTPEERAERRAARNAEAATDTGEPERNRAAADESAKASPSNDETDQSRVKERERRRERNKDGTDTENTKSGDDGQRRKNADESARDDASDDGKHRNRDGREDAGAGGNSGREDGNDSGGRDENKGKDGNGGKNGKDGKDGKDGANGSAGENGNDGENGENGDDGGNGGNGGDGGAGDSGGNGGDGGDGGSSDDDGTGGNGGNGGDGGDGTAGSGGSGGNGGDGGTGTRGGNGGDGGDGGDSASDPDETGTHGGDGGSGGSGGNASA